MNKIKYFFNKYGVQYTVISMIDCIYSRSMKKSNKKIHKKRTEIIKKYLNKKYKNTIEKYKMMEDKGGMIEEDSPIWLFWWQGTQNIPVIATECLWSIKQNCGKHPVIIIDKYNISEYVNISDKIINKVENGYYGIPYLSDWLRVKLLYEYGGIWLDFTTFLHQPLDGLVCGRKFFTTKHGLFADFHICGGKWAGSYLGAGKGNLFMGFLEEMLRRNIEEEDYLMFYLMIDCFMAIGYEKISYIKQMIDDVPINNTKLYKLMENINAPYDRNLFTDDKLIISKLTYKKDVVETVNGKLTNYGYMVSQRKGACIND